MTMPNAADRAEQLLAMTQRLDTLVLLEIEAIKARRLDGGSADWDEKERLTHAWRLEVAHLKANPAALAGVSGELKTRLREAAAALEEKLESHARALAAMKAVTEGLVRSIATEIASARSAPAAYGRHGGVNPAAKREASGLAVDAKA